jgi:LysM repeat protein
VWRSLVVAVGVALAAGCGSSAPPSSAATQLTIERATGTAATVLVPSQATLSCDGSAHGTGFLRRAAGPACALIERGVIQQIAANQRSGRLCSQVYGGPQHAHITGTINRRRVNLTVNRTDGCAMTDWQTLEPLLGDPERQGAPSAQVGPSTAATTTTAPAITYQVRRGETLTGIAKQFGVSVASITALNHLADPDQLVEGRSLLIPPVPPVQLDITPPAAQAGATFALELSGAKPSENITFEIRAPDSNYTGLPHPASADGVVTATYQTNVANTAGIYNVIAKGDQGTTAQATFRVDPANPQADTPP